MSDVAAAGAGLRALPTPLLLQTSTDRIVEDFYEPALRVATSYDRGVGYFTSGWLRMMSRGIAAFAGNGGRARFLVSPHMSEADWRAIETGTEARSDEIIRRALDAELAALIDQGLDEDVVTLGRMVADEVLDFQVVIPMAELGGDFHDKFGIFRDASGDAIAFHGSQNDSVKAFSNFEAISLYYSWLGGTDAERVAAHSNRFNRIWDRLDPQLKVRFLPQATLEGLRALGRPPSQPTPPKGEVPEEADRWRHQEEAISAFLAAGAGVLEMATGTGKTRTALRILSALAKRGQVRSAVINMSGTDLLDQWYAELVELDLFPIYRSYGEHHEALAFLNDPAGAILLTSRQKLGLTLARLPDQVMAQSLLICDEVHGLGSPALVAELSGTLSRFGYRLGLSATPEREYDEEGSAFIEAEIGPVLFRFGLEEAIRRGILCEFDYVELDYEFSDEDKAAVRRAISNYHGKKRAGQDPGIETMYRDIAQVAKASRRKLAPFANFIAGRPETLKRSIIFVDNAAYGLLVQQIILPVIPSYHTYYAEDDRANLVRFARGGLDTLITCHRISEGIDIRSVNSVILFSSARSRLETVQRLGRCLRKDPKNPSKRALVVDFIRTDDIDEGAAKPTADEARRDWLRGLAKITADKALAAV